MRLESRRPERRAVGCRRPGLPGLVLALVALPAALACAEEVAPDAAQRWKTMREEMVARQIEARGVRNPRVLDAMRRVERHRFVPGVSRDLAYADHPLPIGMQQTISQPYIVAAMTEAIDPEPGDKVLEIGTGSGYQAAVLSLLVQRVFSIEIIPELAERAREALREQGYLNVEVVVGDGYAGLPREAPFDGIIVTAAPERIPEPLIEQLAVGGRLVIPVGGFFQELRVLERKQEGVETTTLFPVRFVPMTGRAQER